MRGLRGARARTLATACVGMLMALADQPQSHAAERSHIQCLPYPETPNSFSLEATYDSASLRVLSFSLGGLATPKSAAFEHPATLENGASGKTLRARVGSFELSLLLPSGGGAPRAPSQASQQSAGQPSRRFYARCATQPACSWAASRISGGEKELETLRSWQANLPQYASRQLFKQIEELLKRIQFHGGADTSLLQAELTRARGSLDHFDAYVAAQGRGLEKALEDKVRVLKELKAERAELGCD